MICDNCNQLEIAHADRERLAIDLERAKDIIQKLDPTNSIINEIENNLKECEI